MAKPAGHDKKSVLDWAMRAFWERGYGATSVVGPVKTTGLRAGTLNGAFHSKEALILLTLDRYGLRSTENISRSLGSLSLSRAGISHRLRTREEDIADPDKKPRCFWVNSILELRSRNRAIRERIGSHLQAIERLLALSIAEVQSAGESRSGNNPETLVSFFMGSIRGLGLLDEIWPSRSRTHAVVHQALALPN